MLALELVRRSRNMSQADLAVAVKLPQAVISNFENGRHRPRHVIVMHFAHALDIAPEDGMLLLSEVPRIDGAALRSLGCVEPEAPLREETDGDE